MLNITSRLIISLRHFPEWNLDWADTKPQKNQKSLSVEDFLPEEADARELKERAMLFIRRFLVKEWWLSTFLATGHTNYASENSSPYCKPPGQFPQTHCIPSNPQLNCYHIRKTWISGSVDWTLKSVNSTVFWWFNNRCPLIIQPLL